MSITTGLNWELLRRLTEAHGIPGYEDGVRQIVIEALQPHADGVRTDTLGNVIAVRKGQGRRKVMLAAHMDEIGFMVSHIDEKGFLRIDPLGGFDARVLLAHRVVVHTQEGDYVGLIGAKPPHVLPEEERKKAVELKELFIDLGLPSEEVVKRVRIGDPVTLHQTFVDLGDVVSCKALDDRVGLFVMLEAFRQVHSHQIDLYAVATVQEEVGLRGARTSAFLVEPDLGIALDVTIASDVPGVQEAERVTQLGKGVAIKLKDSASISNPKLVRRFVQLAESEKIPYQLEILPRGGTDAGAMQLTKAGVAAATLSIPTRYVHSVVEAAHKADIQAAVALLGAFLATAHEGEYAL